MHENGVKSFRILLEVFLGMALLNSSCFSQITPTIRIIGGSITNIANVPFLVNIRSNGRFICGGSLISESHVLTAAHCFDGLVPSSLIVTGGATYLTETGIQSGVQNIYKPRSYNKNTMNSDVAVLKLKGKINGAKIETISLCNSNWSVGDSIKVYGWGQTIEQNSPASNIIRTITIPLIAHSTCERKYRYIAQITNTMICATVPGSKDACSGDSGGPAIYNGQICGIVSWGVGCARNNFPGVYTNVKKVKTFIQQAILK